MNMLVWKKCGWAPYYYHAHILTDGIYTGIGRFCDTWEDVVEFAKEYNCTKIYQSRY